jgi:hypothetical protein
MNSKAAANYRRKTAISRSMAIVGFLNEIEIEV